MKLEKKLNIRTVRRLQEKKNDDDFEEIKINDYHDLIKAMHYFLNLLEGSICSAQIKDFEDIYKTGKD